jgi:mono/diheme cytochrome c family protein
MPLRTLRPCVLILLVGCARAAAAEPAGSDAVRFETHVRPLLKAHCFRCHGGEDEAKGGLDLRLRRLMADGGDSGSAIAPGHKEQSLVYQRIASGEMPPVDLKLTAEQVALVGRWIDAGAPTARPEPEKLDRGVEITPEERAFWSFQPLPRDVPVPASSAADRVRTPIDAFLVEALRARQLAFSVEADRRALLIRLSLDLCGLPPSREEFARFEADDSADAYEKAVDGLLDSPHYGERWARVWLDVAGYADSDGYTAADAPRQFAYKYRDYVIGALNADKPLDRFIAEQLAGDELAGGPTKELAAEQIELLAATGFLRMAADGTATGGIDQEVARNQVLADTIKIVTTSMLGLSVACAQCHDHRYDPIPQADYYRLRAVFEPVFDAKHWRTPDQRLVSLWTDAERTQAAAVDAELAKLGAARQARQSASMDAALDTELTKYDDELRGPLELAYRTPLDKRTDEQKKLMAVHPAVNNLSPGVLYQYDPKAADELKKMDTEIAATAAKKPFQDFLPVANEAPGELPQTFLLHRGDPRQPKQQIGPGGLTVCASSGERLSIETKNAALASSGRRLALARWLTSDANPLTARVLVNRVWLGHFGRGLVNTPSDFGAMGEKPSHPELLDWLARDFVRGGWRLKRLHRQIVTSTAYRQSSRRDERTAQLDPEDRWYGRATVRRLDAETLRDRILAASGTLSPRVFGPPVPVKEDGVGQVVVGVDAPAGGEPPVGHEAFRRSIYVQVRRSQPLAMLQVFDAPVMETNCDRRVSSTVATQSLMLLNSDFVLQQAGYFAARVRREASDPADQVRTVWQMAFGRAPDARELEQALAFLVAQVQPTPTPQPQDNPPAGAAAPAPVEPPIDGLTNLCQILLGTNEFLYIE